MPVEVATSDVLVLHHARIHIAGHVLFRDDVGEASIVVEGGATGGGEELEVSRSVAESRDDRYLLRVAGDTRATVGPGVYRARLLVQRPADVLFADLRHVLLGTDGD